MKHADVVPGVLIRYDATGAMDEPALGMIIYVPKKEGASSRSIVFWSDSDGMLKHQRSWIVRNCTRIA